MARSSISICCASAWAQGLLLLLLCLAVPVEAQPTASPSAGPLDAHARLAALDAVKAGRDAEARRWIEDAQRALAAQRQPPLSEILDTIGEIHLRLGELNDARIAWTRLLQAGQKGASNADQRLAHTGLGRISLAAHDPAAAIPALEQALTYADDATDRHRVSAWLIRALMTQAASPSDAYVVRAFAVARQATSWNDVAARPLGPREALLAYFIGDEAAHGFAATNEGVVGFELPSPVEIAAAVERMRARIDSNDVDGLWLAAEEFTPALLGPVMPRLRDFNRIIVSPDGPLTGLPFAALPLAADGPFLAQRVSIGTAGAGSALSTIWTVPEGDDRRIRADVDAGVRRGKSQDRALRIAQMQDISGGGDTAKPRAWAAYIAAPGPAGDADDDESVPSMPYGTLALAGGIVALALVAGIVALLRR